MTSGLRTVVGRQAERVAVWTLVLVVLVSAAGLIWLGTPFHGSEASIQSTLDDERLTVTESGGTYTIRPADSSGDVGLVFYPGARVHPDAYLASLAPLAREANATVVVPKLRLNLAVLDIDAADRVREAHPEIDRWYVGGHSLGGAMACRYARSNAEAVEGLVLYAAYCDRSIADTDLRVLSVTGDADTVLDDGTYERNIPNLPDSATLRSLPGVNHTQFGSYTGQAGDAPSGTAYPVAHRRLANATVPWLPTVSSPGVLTGSRLHRSPPGDTRTPLAKKTWAKKPLPQRF